MIIIWCTFVPGVLGSVSVGWRRNRSGSALPVSCQSSSADGSRSRSSLHCSHWCKHRHASSYDWSQLEILVWMIMFLYFIFFSPSGFSGIGSSGRAVITVSTERTETQQLLQRRHRPDDSSDVRLDALTLKRK